ncbi:MAG: XRE family transcriptional regulator [Bacteroidota bacterium]|nr:XRE family transcriptional regulator [Bacteroidota bacterium]
MKTQEVILIQADKRIQKFAKISEERPPQGWIYTLRNALGMSMRQLGKLAKITPQGIKDMEDREKNGNITIAALEQIGKALNMRLVYGFVPVEGSLKKKIDKKALDVAKKIVLRTSNSMMLENQKVRPTIIKKSITAKALEIKQKNLKSLWE